MNPKELKGALIIPKDLSAAITLGLRAGPCHQIRHLEMPRFVVWSGILYLFTIIVELMSKIIFYPILFTLTLFLFEI